MAHYRKRGKTWNAEVSLGFNTDGTRKRSAKSGFRTKKQAIEWATLEEIRHKNGMNTIDSKMPLKDFMYKWFREVCSRNSTNTRTNHLSRMNYHVIPSLGNIPLNKLSVSHVQEFYNALSSKGLKASTKNKIIQTLSNALRYAQKLKLISYLPTDIERDPLVKEPIEYYTKEEVMMILNALEETWCHLPIMISVMTGIRPGELMGLQWKHVNLQNQTIEVTQQVIRQKEDNGEARLILSTTLKTRGSKRILSIPKILVNRLEQHQKTTHYKNRNNFIITTKEGEMNSTDTLRSMFTKSFRKVQMKHRQQLENEGYSEEDIDDLLVKKIDYYNFRHTHATMLLNNNVNIKTISERLGHQSIKTTLDVYAAVLPKSEKEAMQILDSLFA